MPARDIQHLSKRNFLYVTTGAFASVGLTLTAWPLLDQMNPDAATRDAARFSVNLAPLGKGEAITFDWRGTPVEVRRLTEREINEVQAVPIADFSDQASRNANVPHEDASYLNRITGGRAAFVVLVPVCTLHRCDVLRQSGRFGGWICPCCASRFDAVGRVRYGPAPTNLPVPRFRALGDATLQFDLSLAL